MFKDFFKANAEALELRLSILDKNELNLSKGTVGWKNQLDREVEACLDPVIMLRRFSVHKVKLPKNRDEPSESAVLLGACLRFAHAIEDEDLVKALTDAKDQLVAIGNDMEALFKQLEEADKAIGGTQSSDTYTDARNRVRFRAGEEVNALTELIFAAEGKPLIEL